MNSLTSNMILAFGLLLATSPVSGQQPDASAPSPCTASSTSLCRQTLHDKFMSYAIDTFGPRALFVPLVPAAYLMAFPPHHYPDDWRQGMSALGRNYGDQLASQTSFETARFVTGAILHEDLRYHRSGSKNPLARAGHALAFSFVDKSDSGRTEIAWSNFVGATASGYVGRLYLPAGFNDVTHADVRVAIRFGAVAGRNIAEEFTPELLRLTKKLHIKVIHLIPEWWTRLDR
jgi:hypothetical protein